ncbi:hypothetical protein AVEN_264369-1 [Araneus ventricosus]|uniref:Uncharacterized protein n=1 Tax=Araneus ventricosus TaxID=182803 RepID=A0A4Y2H783_ARAVE|nr:hypothetical protein AVEN_264369-1 [Araneus ventricosus]
MVFTPANHQKFQTAINCSICVQPLTGDQVRDHDHLTGVYRGASCPQFVAHEFSWSQEPVDFPNTPDNSDEGYILEVDWNTHQNYTTNTTVIPWPRKKVL